MWSGKKKKKKGVEIWTEKQMMKTDRGGKDGRTEQTFLWWTGSSTEERREVSWLTFLCMTMAECLFHTLPPSVCLSLLVQRFSICHFISQCLLGGWCTRLRLAAGWHTWEVALTLWVNVHFSMCTNRLAVCLFVCVCVCVCAFSSLLQDPKIGEKTLELFSRTLLRWTLSHICSSSPGMLSDCGEVFTLQSGEKSPTAYKKFLGLLGIMLLQVMHNVVYLPMMLIIFWLILVMPALIYAHILNNRTSGHTHHWMNILLSPLLSWQSTKSTNLLCTIMKLINHIITAAPHWPVILAEVVVSGRCRSLYWGI